MESNVEVDPAVVSVRSYWGLWTVLESVQKQRTRNNFQVLMESHQLEFVAGNEIWSVINAATGTML